MQPVSPDNIAVPMIDLPNKNFLIHLHAINAFSTAHTHHTPRVSIRWNSPSKFDRENQIRNSSVIRVGNKLSCVGFRNVRRYNGNEIMLEYFPIRSGFIIIICDNLHL